MSAAFSDSFIRNIKTTGRYTDAATQGLNLQVKVNGGKYWAMRYLFQSTPVSAAAIISFQVVS